MLESLGLDSKNLAATSMVEAELSALGGFAQVVGIKNRCVYIEVENSVYLQECNYHRTELIKKLSDMIPPEKKVLWQVKFFLKGTYKPRSERLKTKLLEPKETKPVYRKIRHGARKKLR